MGDMLRITATYRQGSYFPLVNHEPSLCYMHNRSNYLIFANTILSQTAHEVVHKFKKIKQAFCAKGNEREERKGLPDRSGNPFHLAVLATYSSARILAIKEIIMLFYSHLTISREQHGGQNPSLITRAHQI
jgi:hypothetical protein